jgi:hypothetical protein
MLNDFVMKPLREIFVAIPTQLEVSLVRKLMSLFGTLLLSGARLKLMLEELSIWRDSASLDFSRSDKMSEFFT